MEKEEHKKWNHKNWKRMHGGGGVYGLGFIGALIYYIQHAQTFMDGVLGFLKAIVWPAFLVHKIFSLLGM